MLDVELVLENIPGSTREEVYSNMLSTLADYAELELNITDVVAEMIGKEDSVGMMFPRLAMPHLRIPGLHDLFIVIGMPENPESVNSQNPADMIFMSLIGDEMSDVYLKIASSLARYMMKPENAESLLQAARNGKDALLEHLQAGNITLRNVVTAEDLMSPADVVVPAEAPLSQAFDLFSQAHRKFLPVVDKSGKLVGELSARSVIKSFIPEYVYMMDNIKFLNDFAVFNEILESEHSKPVAEYMDKTPVCAALDTPLIQLTVLLTKQTAGNVYIVDENNTLRGIFGIDNIISKVLRG